MASEIKGNSLVVRVRKEQRRPGSPAFVLDVSAEIPPGVAILFGLSGAGKSTLLDCIAGLVRPEAGHIAINGDSLFDSETGINLPAQQRRIAYVFQSLALFPHLSVEANVSYGLTHMPAFERREKVAEILEAFGVAKLRARKPEEISGGEQQRVALARSLVTAPRILLLDEPLTGLDARIKSKIMDDLRVWNAARQIPIVYVTHSREEVDALGERVIALDHGRVLSEGTPLEVLDVPRRKRLAQAAGFENLLRARVMDLREPDGVMRVRLLESPCELEVPLGYALPGTSVQVAIRAGDILLATERPVALSARNVLEGKIVSLENRGVLVVVRVDCGVVFTVHVTPGAARTLGLETGQRVWLVVKTHSCHFVED